MQRPTAALLVGGMLILAGCGSLPVINDQGQTTTPTETTTNTQNLYTAETSTGEIALQLSDLSLSYNYTGESSRVSTGDVTELEQQNIIKTQERSFLLADQSEIGEKPLIILSFVYVYETPSQAESALQDHFSNFEQSNVSQVEVSGFTGQKVLFTNRDGLRNVAIYGQDKNMVFYLIVADPNTYFERFVTDLFTKMYVDLPR